jgi:hypothetical protein
MQESGIDLTLVGKVFFKMQCNVLVIQLLLARQFLLIMKRLIEESGIDLMVVGKLLSKTSKHNVLNQPGIAST